MRSCALRRPHSCADSARRATARWSDSKLEGLFPKVLCLDQNKWIDLARAHYTVDGDGRFVDALAGVRSAVERGRLVVPIFPSNAAEIAEPSDLDHRKRIATFMVELAGNRFFAYPETAPTTV
jgi:hypothetical protein